MSDSRADARRFDPRFDPAFQPGYDPTNDASAAARVVPRTVELTPPDRWTTPPEPAARSIAESSRPPVARPEQIGRPVPVDGADDPFSAEEAAGDDSDAETRQRGANPFAVILWVVGIVLVAAGITVFRSIPGLEAQNSAGDAGGQASLTQLLAVGTMSAVLIGVGLAVIAGNLFLLAARWEGRDR